jgi:hypothetical protein
MPRGSFQSKTSVIFPFRMGVREFHLRQDLQKPAVQSEEREKQSSHALNYLF